MNYTSYKSQGKLVYNHLTATVKGSNIHSTVIVNGHNIAIDDSLPVTAKRMAEITEKVQNMTGEIYTHLVFNLSAFEPGEYDGANPLLWKKEYHYYPLENSLLISENGEWVYANDNGSICKDKAALADTLN